MSDQDPMASAVEERWRQTEGYIRTVCSRRHFQGIYSACIGAVGKPLVEEYAAEGMDAYAEVGGEAMSEEARRLAQLIDETARESVDDVLKATADGTTRWEAIGRVRGAAADAYYLLCESASAFDRRDVNETRALIKVHEARTLDHLDEALGSLASGSSAEVEDDTCTIGSKAPTSGPAVEGILLPAGTRWKDLTAAVDPDDKARRLIFEREGRPVGDLAAAHLGPGKRAGKPSEPWALLLRLVACKGTSTRDESKLSSMKRLKHSLRRRFPSLEGDAIETRQGRWVTTFRVR